MIDFFEYEELIQDLPIDFNYNFEGNQNNNSSNDWTKLISTSLDTATKLMPQQGSRLSEEAKQGIATKREAEGLRKRIKAECGRKPITGKNKKLKYEECKSKAVDKFDAKFSETRTSNEMKQGVLIQLRKQEQEQKQSTKKLYLVGGIIALTLVLGTIIYIKSKK